MRVAAVALLSLALGACSTSMTYDQAMARYGTTDPAAIRAIQQQNYNQAMAGIQATNNQLQQTVSQGWVTLQQGQQAPAVGDYRYQNSAGTWIYCQRVSSSVINCREL